MLGRDKDGQPVQLKDVGLPAGRLRPPARDRRSRRHRRGGRRHRHHGAGPERPGGDRALLQKLEALKASLPEGIEIVPTYNRSALDLGHADELLPGDRLRADRRHSRDCRRAEKHPRGRGAGVRVAARHAVHGCCRSRRSVRRSICFRWPDWPSRSARWPTRPS